MDVHERRTTRAHRTADDQAQLSPRGSTQQKARLHQHSEATRHYFADEPHDRCRYTPCSIFPLPHLLVLSSCSLLDGLQDGVGWWRLVPLDGLQDGVGWWRLVPRVSGRWLLGNAARGGRHDVSIHQQVETE